MATGTSRSTALATAAAVAVVALAGCGASASPHPATSTAPARTSPFAWLHPKAMPPGWPILRIPDGATMAYPAGWTPIKGDPGTASVALFGPSHRYFGYLNLTPRQGAETVGNWGRFRVDHQGDEGAKDVTTLAAVTGRRVGDATDSCVEDAYTTTTGERYVEIACIVQGRRNTVVAVGASPPQELSRTAPLLQRALTTVES